MRNITVSPEILEQSATKIDEEKEQYQRLYGQLFETVDFMRSSWSGKDNTAFSNQIRKFENDFREVSILCASYSEFLRNSARAYRETQDAIASQAAHLAQ